MTDADLEAADAELARVRAPGDLRILRLDEVARFLVESPGPQRSDIIAEVAKPVPYLLTFKHQDGRTWKAEAVGVPRIGEVLDLGMEVVTVDRVDDDFVVRVSAAMMNSEAI